MDSINALAVRIRQDRTVNNDVTATITSHLVVGHGFLPGDKHEDVPGDKDEEEHNEDGAKAQEEKSFFATDSDSEDDEFREGDDLEEDAGASDQSVHEHIAWLNSLTVYNEMLHAPCPPGFPTQCPDLILAPRKHQLRCLGLIERARNGPLKTFLVADPPGLGKTLISMMSTVKAKASAKRFSIVVAPSSCVDQWYAEFHKFFTPNSVRVLIVRDPTIPPTKLLQYDVLILSYSFVMSRYRKWEEYLTRIAVLKDGLIGPPPPRPNLSVFSELFNSADGIKSPFLVLDEVNAVKNSKTTTFRAVYQLRQQCDMCLMLTGSPIDNTWLDIFALLQFVKGHSINTKGDMMKLLGTRGDDARKWKPPSGARFLRLIQMLNSFIVRRPQETIALPPLHEMVVEFELDPNEAGESNSDFDTYEIAVRITASEGDRNGQPPPFKSLTRALQHACHSELVSLMEFIRISKDPDVLDDPKSIAKWTDWREKLRFDGKWQSSRITAIIDAFNKCRDLDPDFSVAIIDESVFFLDIVQIAFSAMYDPVVCLRYDGRVDPDKRPATLVEHEQAAGSSVLLVSRSTGGIGLNMPWVNVIIQCCPWWKREWENQSKGRAWREGQRRSVTYIQLVAKNCDAERYKIKRRNRKQKFNEKVLKAITRSDDEKVETWDFE